MTVKPRLLYTNQLLLFIFHLLGIFGAIAQNQTNNYSGLNLKFICPKREIVAGENLEFQVVISNSAQRIRVAAPLPILFLNLIVQADGTNIPYQIKYQLDSRGADIDFEANSATTIDKDLCAWFPLGLYAGEFTLSMSYIPNRENRSFAIRSNAIQITVVPRSPQQEMEYKSFINILSWSTEKAIQEATQFLANYTNSIFEPRLRLELARQCVSPQNYDFANKLLEPIPMLPSATKGEINSKYYLSARILRAQGYLFEAIAEAEKCPSLRPITQQWKNVILKARATLKPEALEVSPGILTAFVRLPDGYPVKNITSATCDGANADKMMLSENGKEMIIKFRRQDIEKALAQIGQTIDTNFVVRGVWRGATETNFFEGTASIKKIVGEKEKEKKK